MKKQGGMVFINEEPDRPLRIPEVDPSVDSGTVISIQTPPNPTPQEVFAAGFSDRIRSNGDVLFAGKRIPIREGDSIEDVRARMQEAESKPEKEGADDGK